MYINTYCFSKVILRHNGTALKTAGSNILVMPWIPQNDLLAHPATRLFITHCGISSTYETAIHGVPVIAVPFSIDQPSNADKLVNRYVCFRKKLLSFSFMSKVRV